MKINKIILCLNLSIFSFFHLNEQSVDANTATPHYSGNPFTNPEPNDLKPYLISAANGNLDITYIKGTTGFEAIYFSNVTINRILEEPNCVGIRFYSAWHSTLKMPTLIAIGVDINGVELDNENQNYMISNGKNSRIDANTLNKADATTAVVNFKNTIYKSYSSFFSKTVIQNNMNLENAEGIIIYPSVRKFTNYRGIISSLPTMMMRLAVINEGIVDVQGGSEASYLKTIEPCPMVCGNMINYLVTPE